MTLLNHLFPNIPNYYNLALFICQLFADGNFRTGHILHHRETSFIDQLIIETEAICSHPIPWLTTDVTQRSSVPWTPNDRTDYILQLIFLDLDHLPKNSDEIKDYLTFYHLFVFQSANGMDLKTHLAEIKTMNEDNFGSMVLHRNLGDGSIGVHWILNDDIKLVYPHDQNNKNLFDVTFGKYEQTWSIAIKSVYEFSCDSTERQRKKLYTNDGDPFAANFLQRQLNSAFTIDLLTVCKGSTRSWTNRIFHHKHRRFYKELLPQNENVGREKFKSDKNRKNILNVDWSSKQLIKNSGTKSLSAYQYQSSKLFIIFFYGDDLNSTIWTRINAGSSDVILVFLVLATGALCYLRRKLRLRRDGLISSFIDLNIFANGGGNIVIHHKLERLFFAIFFCGFFFLWSIYAGTVFSNYFLIHESVTTFEKLADVKSPIYIPITLTKYENIIIEMLRNKNGLDLHYRGATDLKKKISEKNTYKSFAVVIPESYVESFKFSPPRDYDVIKPSLGSLNFYYQMTSKQYIPERMVRQINKVTISMKENGLQTFYQSFGSFLSQLRNAKVSEVENYVPVKLGHISFLLFYFGRHSCISFIVFLIEILVYKFKQFKRSLNQLIATILRH